MIIIACALLVLVAPLLIMTLPGLFVEQTEPTSPDAETSTEINDGGVISESWEGGSFAAFDTLINYILTDELIVHGNVLGGSSFVDSGSAGCNVLVRKSALTTLTAGDVAELVGSCFGVRVVSDLSEVEIYRESYRDAYLESCGEKYEPLSFGGVLDGSCELPDPINVYELH